MITLNTNKTFKSAILGEWQTPEIELILYCSRTKLDGKMADLIEAISYSNLNWDSVVKLAYKNGVNCLLYNSLNKICPEAVPKDVWQKLRNDFIFYNVKNKLLTKELTRLLEKFEQENIPAFPYKGPALTTALYRDLSLRYFCDLDILINHQDLVKVKNLLVAEGYETPEVNDEQEIDNVKSDNERDFVRKDGKVAIDLHWQITPRFFPFKLSFESLWENRQPLSILGSSVWNLAPEDLLLILCVHGAKEFWHKLIWICDLAELIDAYPDLDWEKVMTQAQKLHCERILLLGLFLAQELRGTKIPEEIVEKIAQDKVVNDLARKVGQVLVGKLYSKTKFSADLMASWFRISTRDRWQDKLEYFWHRTVSPNFRDRKTIILPKSLGFLYYLIRPWRLIIEKFKT